MSFFPPKKLKGEKLNSLSVSKLVFDFAAAFWLLIKMIK